MVLPMVSKFLATTTYKSLPLDLEKIAVGTKELIEAGVDTSVLILSMDGEEAVGLLGIKAFVLPVNDLKIAQEILWWVEPEYRKSRRGLELYMAGEYWAKKVGCSLMQMVSQETFPEVEVFYERKGYRKAEQAWIKEL